MAVTFASNTNSAAVQFSAFFASIYYCPQSNIQPYLIAVLLFSFYLGRCCQTFYIIGFLFLVDPFLGSNAAVIPYSIPSCVLVADLKC